MISPVKEIPPDDFQSSNFADELNDRLRTIAENFEQVTRQGVGPDNVRTYNSNYPTSSQPYSYVNPVVNVYEFLDPLYGRLRTAQQQVSEVQVLPNAIGQNQLQIDSIVARHIVAGTITADKLSVNELSAITGNIGTITAGNITLDTAGFIRGGATAYDAGSGFWMGYDTSAYKFFIGNSSGNKITWNGTTLSISGGAVSSVDWQSQVTGAGKPDNYADVTAANTAAAITGQGALATQNSAAWSTDVSGRPTELTDGRITTAINSAGLVISGVKPAINVTTGIAGLYLGADYMGYYNGSSWKTYMDSSGNFYLGGTSGSLTWNGTTLAVTGDVTATSGTIGGFTIGSTTITGTNIYLGSSGSIGVGSSGTPHAPFDAYYATGDVHLTFGSLTTVTAGHTYMALAYDATNTAATWEPFTHTVAYRPICLLPGHGTGTNSVGVGIGITAPTSLLHMYSSTIDCQIALESDDASSHARYVVFRTSGTKGVSNVDWYTGMRNADNNYYVASWTGSVLTNRLAVSTAGLEVAGALSATGLISGGPGLTINGALVANKTSSVTLDQLTGSISRIIAWGPDALTPGTLRISVVSSDASAGTNPVADFTSTGLAVTGTLTTSSTTLHTSSVALTNGAGANAGTITNAPTAGNPTKWVPIVDNGTTRYVPAW